MSSPIAVTKSADGYTRGVLDSEYLGIARIAGERNPDSETNNYLAVREEWNYTVVSLADDSTTVSAVPAVLGRVYVDAVMSAHACPFKDGATTVFSLVASLAAGTQFTGMQGTRFATSLIVDPDNAATGTIVVQWRPI